MLWENLGDMSKRFYVKRSLYAILSIYHYEDNMAYDRRKIANSFYLPKRPFLHGIARMLDFSGSFNSRMFDQILERSDADSMRADWEAVGESLRWAIAEYEKELAKKDLIESKPAN